MKTILPVNPDVKMHPKKTIKPFLKKKQCINKFAAYLVCWSYDAWSQF